MSISRGGRMRANSRGFSLVELLVVMTIFGVMSTVILNLYVNVVRSTTSSEEVVEVQQGLRIALDQVARDIQMAGFLVPTTPITVASNDLITLETATAFGAFARIPAEVTFAVGTSPVNVIVNKTMADLFREDNYVRIITPIDGCQPTSTATDCARDGAAPHFQITNITEITPATDPPTTKLELTPKSPFATAVTIPVESIIVRVPSPTDDATYPNVVTYQLEDDPASADPNMMVLSRIWRTGLTPLTIDNRNTNERIIATNVSGLSFEYLMDDGTVETAVVANRRDKIVGVRILLTGLTEDAKTRGSKIRELQTTVKIRNI